MTQLSSARVLVVDDQSLVRVAIRIMLEAMAVQEVLEAKNGEEAIAVLQEHHVDVVISDIDMSPQNGMEFLRNIRCGNYGMRRDTRLIMLTGLTAPEVAKACIKLDVNAFLNKPAKRDMLAERLQFALSMPLTLETVEHYSSQELPRLVRAQPMVAMPERAANQNPVPRQRAPAPAAPPSPELKPVEHGMAYVIWHERLQTGIADVDVIIREAASRLNETYQARGNGQSFQTIDRRMQDWLHFANLRLPELEQGLTPFLSEEQLGALGRQRRELQSRLSQVRLLLQAAPDAASYELFDVVRNWWTTAYSIWRKKD